MVFNGLMQKALTEPRTDKVQFFHKAWKRVDIPLHLAILRTSETIIEIKSVNNRSSHLEVLNKRYLKICSKFTWEHPNLLGEPILIQSELKLLRTWQYLALCSMIIYRYGHANHANWKSTDKWSLTCLKSALKNLHSNYW